MNSNFKSIVKITTEYYRRSEKEEIIFYQHTKSSILSLRRTTMSCDEHNDCEYKFT